MVRRSPQTERLVEIVEYLADRPTDGRSLADISRTLGADKATLFPMLTELTRVGWVVKHPTKKTYRLGPRLAPVGDSARIAVNAIAPARKPMSRLAIESGNVCCLIVPSGGDLVGEPRGVVGKTAAVGQAAEEQNGDYQVASI